MASGKCDACIRYRGKWGESKEDPAGRTGGLCEVKSVRAYWMMRISEIWLAIASMAVSRLEAPTS